MLLEQTYHTFVVKYYPVGEIDFDIFFDLVDFLRKEFNGKVSSVEREKLSCGSSSDIWIDCENIGFTVSAVKHIADVEKVNTYDGNIYTDKFIALNFDIDDDFDRAANIYKKAKDFMDRKSCMKS